MTPAPHFDLIDHHGRQVSAADFAGRHRLVYFGFTHCRVVCPRTLGKLSRVLDRLGDAAATLAALYITVDPERDTPAVMKTYLENAYPRFVGLTGPAEQVDEAKRSFRVFARRKDDPDDPDGYAVPHTALIYLLDGQGRYLTHFAEAADEATIHATVAQALGPGPDSSNVV